MAYSQCYAVPWRHDNLLVGLPSLYHNKYKYEITTVHVPDKRLTTSNKSVIESETKERRITIFSEPGSTLATIAWYFGPRGLNGECCEDLSMPEFMALDKVSTTPDCSVQEVGQRLGFSKSGATRVVNRLKRKGYIKKMRSDEDGRICCIAITGKGEQILKSTDLHYQQLFEEIVSKIQGLSGPEIAAVFSLVAAAANE